MDLACTASYANALTKLDGGIGVNYDADLGRWLTPDPIGYKVRPNLYAYVNNGPLTHLDLYGLYAQTYRDRDYSGGGPVGRGNYNALSDPVGTIDRYRSYASELTSAVWNRDFSSISQKWDRMESFSNFSKERMGEMVMLGYAGAARTGVAAARASVMAGQRVAGFSSLAVRAGTRWAYSRLTSGNELKLGTQQPPNPIRSQSYTNSNLKLGRQMHDAYKLGEPGRKEFRLPSGRRIDFLDPVGKKIFELKPNNPRAVKLGEKQLQSYAEEIKTVPEYQNTEFTTILETY